MGKVVVNKQAVIAAYRRDVVPEWQDTTADLMLNGVTATAPVVTGFMRTAMKTEPITHTDGSPGVRLTGRADYTVYVDQGTGLYGPMKQWITPQRAAALSWLSDGKRVTRKRVRGQRGQHFFARGLQAFFDRVIEHPR